MEVYAHATLSTATDDSHDTHFSHYMIHLFNITLVQF